MSEKLTGYLDQYLFHIKHSPLTRKNGIIAVICGDCDRAEDLMAYEKRLCLKTGDNNRVHRIALNGGCLSIATNSPANEAGKSMAILFDIGGAVQLKDIKEVALYAHYPCGQANVYSFEEDDYLEWLCRAAEHCENQFDELKFACKFHVEIEPGKFKTYFFDHKKWRQDHAL